MTTTKEKILQNVKQCSCGYQWNVVELGKEHKKICNGKPWHTQLRKEKEVITPDRVKEIWGEVFPNSMIIASKACLGDSYFFKGKLAKDINESNNRILHNDALNYMFNIDGDTYKENYNSLYIKPDPEKERYLVYGSSHMRKKTIKNITEEKLLKRFKQVKEHVVANKDNFKNLLFDINDKI